MKCFLAICIFFFFVPSVCFAASSITWIDYTTEAGGIQIVAEVTADTDGSVTTEQFQNKNGYGIDFTKGYYLYSWEYYVGGTAPTADSDLEVLEHANDGYDILNGAGTDTIDATDPTDNGFQPEIGGTAGFRPVYGDLYLKISNNSENAATFTLIFNFAPMSNRR